MNTSEAKSILMLYRPGMADAEDPQVAEALALAEDNAELAAWLAARAAQHEALRGKFRQIAPPAGLKEQIISEHAASRRPVSARSAMAWVLASVTLLLLLGTAAILHVQTPAENTLALYQRDMVRLALRGYPMDLTTNDAGSIRAFLAGNHAPADFKLRAELRKTAIIGCGVEDWQGAKVSLVCFHTGKPLPPGVASDLWLFVVDRAALKNPPDTNVTQLAKVNRLATATWTEGGKLYLLGLAGDEADIMQYL